MRNGKSGKGVQGQGTARKICGIAAMIAMVAACAPITRGGTTYAAVMTEPVGTCRIGDVLIHEGNQVRVQQACLDMGLIFLPRHQRVLGCADLKRRTIWTIADPRILEHELCHLRLNTISDADCPLPEELTGGGRHDGR
jgi:hypothetical protein